MQRNLAQCSHYQQLPDHLPFGGVTRRTMSCIACLVSLSGSASYAASAVATGPAAAVPPTPPAITAAPRPAVAPAAAMSITPAASARPVLAAPAAANVRPVVAAPGQAAGATAAIKPAAVAAAPAKPVVAAPGQAAGTAAVAKPAAVAAAPVKVATVPAVAVKPATPAQAAAPAGLTGDNAKLAGLVVQRDQVKADFQAAVSAAQAQFAKDRNATAFQSALANAQVQLSNKVTPIFQQMIGVNRTGIAGDDITLADIKAFAAKTPANTPAKTPAAAPPAAPATAAAAGNGNAATTATAANNPAAKPVVQQVPAGLTGDNAKLAMLVIQRDQVDAAFRQAVTAAQVQFGKDGNAVAYQNALSTAQAQLSNKVTPIFQQMIPVNHTGLDGDDITLNDIQAFAARM
ncbi:hypothetical protein [Bradyrhizobium sp. STM 3809]|uniref:hypothetical protein n=1 Tax=Bradyrhizobium sp. STM 3809 TaxID=551936 RepID=UPI000240932C|nr:hypothetical protein [Bradyrhizobium sp. STM 3809]CCE01193.1 exported hypothetical protein [Bradyrhizobium sp. STM 3809]